MSLFNVFSQRVLFISPSKKLKHNSGVFYPYSKLNGCVILFCRGNSAVLKCVIKSLTYFIHLERIHLRKCVFEQVGEKLDQLKKQHNDKMAMKESLRKKSEDMEVKLDRAGKLVSGLAGERLRWEERVAVSHTHTNTHRYPHNNYYPCPILI